jgi:hypothetical protein
MADNHEKILSEFDALHEAGLTDFVPQPRQEILARNLRSIEWLSELTKRGGASLDPFASGANSCVNWAKRWRPTPRTLEAS